MILDGGHGLELFFIINIKTYLCFHCSSEKFIKSGFCPRKTRFFLGTIPIFQKAASAIYEFNQVIKGPMPKYDP
jgi:hypothetical protein